MREQIEYEGPAWGGCYGGAAPGQMRLSPVFAEKNHCWAQAGSGWYEDCHVIVPPGGLGLCRPHQADILGIPAS